LRAAVDFLACRPETTNLPIGAFGFSMGGATAILAAAQDCRIAAVATHGAYASIERAVTQRCRKHFGPLGPLAECFTLWFALRLSPLPVPTESVAPIRFVPQLSPRPVLILHGGRDRVVHPTDALDLHAAAGEPKTLHLMPRSGHWDIDE